MKALMSYCGLRCDTCPIHLVSLEADASRQEAMRKNIAEQCAMIYGMTLQPEDITGCDGCRATTGKIFSGCGQCGIRPCASARNIESCASCPDYACTTLEAHFSLDPEARARLEKIRQGKPLDL
jgi:hypothetical protein